LQNPKFTLTDKSNRPNNININLLVITFRVRRSRGEIYIGHGRLCVCLSLAAFPHYCTDPDVSWGNGKGCPLVVHYWADLQSVYEFRCYDNIAPNAKYKRVLVLTLPGYYCHYMHVAELYRPIYFLVG